MSRMNRCLCIVLVMGVGAALLATGCGSRTARFRHEALPGDLDLVGGGLRISWEPLQPGTAYLVEKRTGKIMETRTLTEGEPFLFEVDSIVEAEDIEEMIGVDIEKTEFLLYFKPLERPRAAGQETE